MKLNFSKKIFLYFSAVFIFTFATVSYPQTNEKTQFADSLSILMQKKLLLNDGQRSNLKNIILDYLQNNGKQEQNETNNKISALLDKKQEAKFNIIKDEWWKKINDQLRNKKNN